MRKRHFFDRFILLLAPCLLWGVSGYANVYAQGEDEEQAKQLIVMIDGAVDGSPIQGAGVIFGHNPNRIYIATANHVVRRGTREAEDLRIRLKWLPGESVAADLLAKPGGSLDLAVLVIRDWRQKGILNDDIEALPLDRLGDSNALQYGDDLYSIGYPAGRPWFTNLAPHRFESRDGDDLVFQTQAIIPGYSGGGLFDDVWDLVGMITATSDLIARAINMGRILEKLNDTGYPVNLTTSVGPAVAARGTSRNALDIEFILIPAGTFEMGSTNGQSDEKPVHTVRITRSFFMSATEVTQGQWKAVMEYNPSKFLDDNRPVESVSWNDVQEFIRRLNEREGSGTCYRLPTEAEWEYVARAGTTEDPGDLKAVAWYFSNSGFPAGRTHPVRLKHPNAWGLFDMYGNVREWVSDWYGPYPSGTVTDPTGSESGSARVVRGSSWNDAKQRVRSANRIDDKPNHDTFLLGFRLVREGQ